MKKKIIILEPKIIDYNCPSCLKKGITSKLELLGNQGICPLCKTSITFFYEDPLPNLIDKVDNESKDIVNKIISIDIDQPHDDNAFLLLLLKESRDALLCGLYIPAILSLSCYLESLVKEIIFCNEGTRFVGEFASAINHAKRKKYINEEEHKILDMFREKIRNPMTHANASEIFSDIYIKLNEVTEKELEKNSDFRSCKAISKMINLGDIPSCSFPTMYDTMVKDWAINIFNDVLEFSKDLSFKYLKKEYKCSETQLAFENGLTMEEFNTKMENGEVKKIPLNKDAKILIASHEAINLILK